MGALLELDDRAKLEQFMLKHESGFSYPTVQSDETIFEYVVDSSGTYFVKYCCCLTVRHKWVPEIIDFLLEKKDVDIILCLPLCPPSWVLHAKAHTK